MKIVPLPPWAVVAKLSVPKAAALPPSPSCSSNSFINRLTLYALELLLLVVVVPNLISTFPVISVFVVPVAFAVCPFCKLIATWSSPVPVNFVGLATVPAKVSLFASGVLIVINISPPLLAGGVAGGT